jgi:hypothetical protein
MLRPNNTLSALAWSQTCCRKCNMFVTRPGICHPARGTSGHTSGQTSGLEPTAERVLFTRVPQSLTRKEMSPPAGHFLPCLFRKCCSLHNIFLQKTHNVPRCRRRSWRSGLFPGENKPHCVTPVIHTVSSGTPSLCQTWVHTMIREIRVVLE